MQDSEAVAVVPDRGSRGSPEKVHEDQPKAAVDQMVVRPNFSSDDEDQELSGNVEKKKKKKKKGKKKKQAQLLVYSGKHLILVNARKKA